MGTYPIGDSARFDAAASPHALDRLSSSAAVSQKLTPFLRKLRAGLLRFVKSFERRAQDCFCFQSTIAKYLGCSVRSIQRVLSDLVAGGELKIERRGPTSAVIKTVTAIEDLQLCLPFTEDAGVSSGGSMGTPSITYSCPVQYNYKTERTDHRSTLVEAEEPRKVSREAPADSIPESGWIPSKMLRTVREFFNGGKMDEQSITTVDPATDPRLIVEDVCEMYRRGGRAVPAGHMNMAVGLLVSAPPETRHRLRNYVAWAFVSGLWSDPAHTKSLYNLLRDGDWNVDIAPRTLPEVKDRSRSEVSQSIAERNFLAKRMGK